MDRFTAVEHYQRSDLIKDRVLAGGEALLVLVVSDHGSCDFYEGGSLRVCFIDHSLGISGTVECPSEPRRRTIAEAIIDISGGRVAARDGYPLSPQEVP